MSVQTVLFPGLPLPAERTGRVKGAKGYARPPGSGPAGETCKTCAHCCRVEGGANWYHKCDLLKFRWTHGPGTDVKAKSPACELWKKIADEKDPPKEVPAPAQA